MAVATYPCASAPASPTHKSSITGSSSYAYSAPASPARWLSRVPSFKDMVSKPSAALADTDSDSDSDFEFSTSFASANRLHRPMSYAHELFMDGQVRPLRLPPRLQHPSNGSSPASSPKALRGSDPFVVALELVKKEEFVTWDAVDPPAPARDKSSKKWRFIGFLFRSASHGRADAKDKLRARTEAVSGKRWVGAGEVVRSRSAREVRVSARKAVVVVRKPMSPFRPGLFACLGIGPKTAGGWS